MSYVELTLRTLSLRPKSDNLQFTETVDWILVCNQFNRTFSALEPDKVKGYHPY
jgi:prenyltransferase beta subunit